jgi:hypothetical protein
MTACIAVDALCEVPDFFFSFFALQRREKQNKRYLKEREQDVRKRTDEMRDTFRPGSRLAQQASRRSNDTEGEEEDYIDHSQIGRGRPGNVVPGASDPELDLLKKRKPINFNQKFASAPKINIPTPTRGDSQLDSKIVRHPYTCGAGKNSLTRKCMH